jgi:hypothetical protein
MHLQRILALTLGLALAATVTSASASPITFNFTYAGNGATAVGSVTFESTLIANPGHNSFNLPNPAVLDLHVTVSGASAGNGSFGIGSFDQVGFDTGNATLDFSKNLVGQATPGGAWGTSSGCCGDFNLFSATAPAPNGVFFFTLAADHGNANAMSITSVTVGSAAAAPVPALEDWNLGILAVLVAVGGVAFIRQRSAERSKS